MEKRYTIPGLAIGLVLMLVSVGAADITPTPWSKWFFGHAYYNGQPAPIGSVIDAYDPDGVHCGSFTVGANVDSTGVYGILHAYGDDLWSEDVDEGGEAGDLISFKVNHRDPQVSVISGDVYWQDKVFSEIDLSVDDAIIALTLVDPPSDRVGKPFSIIQIPIGLRNDGNGLDFYSVEAVSTKGWAVNLPGEFTYATAGETVYASFSVETPLWPGPTESDRTDTVDFAVYSELDPAERVEGSLIVKVDAADVYAVVLTMPPDDKIGEPEEVVQFMVGARNVGNVSDEYTIEVDSDLGWEVSTDTKGSAIAQPGEEFFLSFEVTIPQNASDGEMDVLSYTVRSSGDAGVSAGDDVTLTVQSPTDVGDDVRALLPNGVQLAQNYPNPFNPTTTIAFTLPARSRVELEVIDVLGRTVERLDLGVLPIGGHSVGFDGSALASGVYFYRLATDFGAETRKMILLK